MIRMEDAGWIKRTMFHRFMDIAKCVGPALRDRKPVGFIDRVKYAIGDVLFGADVVVRGAVTIEHSGEGQLRIADGDVLEG